jgi:hypothetical protein
MRIWESERRARDLNSKLMWENLKYFGTLISALITASVTLMGFFFTKNPNILIPILIYGLQIFIILLAEYANNDLTERRKRFFLIVSHLLKIEVLLGLYSDDDPQVQKLRQKLKRTSLEDDDYLFVQYKKNLKKREGSEKYDTEQFIKDKMSNKKEDKESEEKEVSSYPILSNVYRLMQWTMTAFIVAEIIILGHATYVIDQTSLVINI